MSDTKYIVRMDNREVCIDKISESLISFLKVNKESFYVIFDSKAEAEEFVAGVNYKLDYEYPHCRRFSDRSLLEMFKTIARVQAKKRNEQ